jgi:hypothetical protein
MPDTPEVRSKIMERFRRSEPADPSASAGSKVLFGSSKEIVNASGISVVHFVSRHSVNFANVPLPDLSV